MSEAWGVDVLAFGAHPDDVELFCGGTLIRLADQGYAVSVVDLTRGELATHGTAEQREQEAQAAAKVLGLRFRENLGLPDGFIHASAEGSAGAGSQLARCVEVLRRRRPEVVLLPWVEERHPDHAAAGALLTRAVFFAGLRRFETAPPSERFVPRQVLYYELRVRMPASFIVDTQEAAARKLQAVQCYASQLAKGPADIPTLVGSPQALEAVEARDRYYGSMIGRSHGEPFRAPNTLGLVDPVGHFRQNPFPQAHAFEALKR